MHNTKPRTSCATKHLIAYERILKGKQNYGLILEDDIKLFDDFNLYVKKCLKTLEMKKISKIFISLEDSNLKYVRRSEKKKNKLLYSKEKGRLAGAYMIDKRAANNMLTYIKNNKSNIPIDWFHNICAEKKLIDIYWIDPPIARQASLSGDLPSLLTEKRTNNLKRKIEFNLQKWYKKILYFFR